MMKFLFGGILRGILAATLIAGGTLINSQSVFAQGVAEDNSPQDAAAESVSGNELFAKLLENNHSRDGRLQQYSETRSYVVTNPKGKTYATTEVRLHYRAPNEKSFDTLCEEGSGTVRNLVFKRLMESEVETASGRSHHDSSITPVNYQFQFLREEGGDSRHYFVVQAIPRRKDKYLFEGTIWIDSQDFAIAKIEGQPARNPSFWIHQVEFVRQYQKVGDFWLPLKDESITHLKIFGTKILTIEHFDYTVNRSETSAGPPNHNFRGCQAGQTVQVTQ
jgi:hypothetical protein